MNKNTYMKIIFHFRLYIPVYPTHCTFKWSRFPPRLVFCQFVELNFNRARNLNAAQHCLSSAHFFLSYPPLSGIQSCWASRMCYLWHCHKSFHTVCFASEPNSRLRMKGIVLLAPAVFLWNWTTKQVLIEQSPVILLPVHFNDDETSDTQKVLSRFLLKYLFCHV